MISEILDQYARTTGRVFEGREHTIGGSDIGQCARKILWTKMEGDPVYGATRDADYVDGWGARLRGTTFENAIWAPAMRARYGDKLLYAGEQQTTLMSDLLSATPDGLLIKQPHNALAELGVTDIGDGGEIVIECKTIDPRARLDITKQEHAYQVQIQLGLFHETTQHRPDFAVISYTDASFWDETTEFVIARDPTVYAYAKQRAEQIMLAKTAVELKPEGWIAGGSECRYCPFTRACGRERTAIPSFDAGTNDPQFLAEMTALARAAKKHEVDGDASYNEKRRIENEIRDRLRNKQIRRLVTDQVRITWSPVRGRPAYDIPAIRAAVAVAGVDISRFETVGANTDRLVVQVLDKAPAPACATDP
jgi:CRISPR/Cas system-associated exonuclease Cas4 (RecB family)